MHGGVVTRYIPSLDGSLYKYDGESIEAVPMSADTLLSSSYKLGDNTMVIGGKDLLSYGIDPNTGQVSQVFCHSLYDHSRLSLYQITTF